MKTIKCHLCGSDVNNYQIGHHYKKCHPDFDYIKYRDNMKLLSLKNYACKYCGKKIVLGKVCGSDECKNKLRLELSIKKYKDKVEGKEYVKCAICGFPAPDIISHICRVHKIRATEYKEKYNSPTRCELYLEALSDKIKGDKNPGYQHGGTLSAYSKNFKKYSELSSEEIESSISLVCDKSKETKKSNPQNESTHIEYYTSRGMSQNDASSALSERQSTFSISKCIDRHGEEEGNRIWKERQYRWQNTMNDKPQEEIERINKLKVLSGNHISKNEKEIYDYLKNIFNDVETQFVIRGKIGHRIFDIRIGNKLIEYNGDYWHCNPNMYSPEFVNKRLSKSAQEVWDRDKNKMLLAEEFGYTVYTIWEQDYKTDKNKALESCASYLK